MERVERKLQNLFSQVTQTVGADRVANLLGGEMRGAARTKATTDKNHDALMAMANLPSRGHYQRLQTKIDSLQGSVRNLTRAVEELRGSLSNGGANARGRSKKAAPAGRKTAAKSRRSTASAKSRGSKTRS